MISRIIALLSLLFLLPSISNCQQPGEISFKDESVMPGGRVGERIQSLIKTINADDAEVVRRFMEEECAEGFRNFAPMEEHIDVFKSIYRQTGGIKFHGIRTYVPERSEETVVILKDENFGAWKAFTFRFDAADDFRVSSLRFSPARTPSNVKEPALTEASFIKEMEQLLDKLCQKDVFSGTVLVADGEKVLFERACGEASKSFHVPNNLDTKFNLGSMNKMFTATAVMQLVEKGKIGLDDPISKYVDESWLPKEITDKVTVHHLLTHTSGLGSYFNDTYWKSSRELYRTVSDFKPLVQGEKLAFEPGERFGYSNTGMLLLGVVIESATGGSYFDYINEHIYKPAGMVNSDSYELDFPVENLAVGYIPAPGSAFGWQNNIFKHVIKGGPAGGGYSTVRDLHRFASALRSGKLVSQASLDKMWKDYSGARYGYGFGVEEGETGKVVGHGGGFPGLNGMLDIYLDRGYIVAVLANYDGAASPVGGRIMSLIGRIGGL
jgi:CubicO group peptidase (beta-lactamase class C family)